MENTRGKTAFLGLGKMGRAIAGQLLKNGCRLRVWNRSPAAAEPVAAMGAEVFASPRGAVEGAEVVFSMLGDDEANQAVILGGTPGGVPGGTDNPAAGAIAGMEPGAIHVCLSTIGVAMSRTLTVAHANRGQHFVAAPVFGRPFIAEQGKLWVAMAGAHSAVERVQPLLATVSRGVTVVSEEPWKAHALKLGGNFMISAAIQALSEGFVFAESQGLSPWTFLETVNNALFQSPFYLLYGKIMLDPPAQAGGTVSLGSKDTSLFREAAAAAGRVLPLADYIAGQFNRAEQAGMKDDDWAVGQYRMAQKHSERPS